MDSLALSNLDTQIGSVIEQIEVFRGRGEVSNSIMAKSVLRSLTRTKACLVQGLDPRAEALVTVSILTCSKVPGCEPILRRGDKKLPLSGHYVAQLFDDAGGKLFDYQLILLDPGLAAEVIDESHATILSKQEMFERDLKTLNRVRRETAWEMDALICFPQKPASAQEAA